MDRVDRLISILFDQRIDLGSRYDAAMNLANHFQDDRALNALLEMGANPDTDETLVEPCADSIGEILIERGSYKRDLLENLTPLTRWHVFKYIRSCKPEWIEEYDLKKLLE